MAVLEPRLSILDEIDSGLDIDALRVVARGVEALRSPRPLHHPGHPLPAAPRVHRPRPHPRDGGAGASSSPAGASWRSSSRRRATPGWSRERSRAEPARRRRVARLRPRVRGRRPARPGARPSSGAACPPPGRRTGASPRWRRWPAHAFGRADPSAPLSAADLERRAGKPFGPRLVFVNGRFRADLSTAHGLPAGIHAASLQHAIAVSPGRVEPHLARAASVRGAPLRGAQRRLPGGRRLRPRRRRGEGRRRGTGLRHRGPAGAGREPPPRARGGRPGERGDPRRDLRGARRSPGAHQRGHRGRARAGARLDHYQVQDQPASAFHFATLAAEQGAGRPPLDPLDRAGRRPLAQRRAGPPRRARGPRPSSPASTWPTDAASSTTTR